MSVNNDQTPVEISQDDLVPNVERDDPPCRQMAAEMERWIERERWFMFEDEYEAIERDEAELAWLRGLLAGGPV